MHTRQKHSSTRTFCTHRTPWEMKNAVDERSTGHKRPPYLRSHRTRWVKKPSPATKRLAAHQWASIEQYTRVPGILKAYISPRVHESYIFQHSHHAPRDDAEPPVRQKKTPSKTIYMLLAHLVKHCKASTQRASISSAVLSHTAARGLLSRFAYACPLRQHRAASTSTPGGGGGISAPAPGTSETRPRFAAAAADAEAAAALAAWTEIPCPKHRQRGFGRRGKR